MPKTDPLDSYANVLAYLSKTGKAGARRSANPSAAPELTFLQGAEGLRNLYLSMGAVAPATPGARDEEWNPLSQRPHVPLPPPVNDEMGAEITALKEAVDAFVTLSHEMMHVALWEPFFTGAWRPRSRKEFGEFSLLAEGFCFFYSDIVVSGAVRVRLPDGEFALERQSPSNARFHPSRAFRSLGISDPAAILDIYLEGFRGHATRLWQPRGTSAQAAAMARQAHDFYADSIPYLGELYGALTAFGSLTQFFRRFCAVPDLPSLLSESHARLAGGRDPKAYFTQFFRSGLAALAKTTPRDVERIRWRRMLQMRAYYAMQVRWVLDEGRMVVQRLPAAARRRQGNPLARPLAKPQIKSLVESIDTYLDGLESQLAAFAAQPDASPEPALARLDADYDAQVRAQFLRLDAWAGQRWLIAPRRAGGGIDLSSPPPASARAAKVRLLGIVAFLVDELTARVRASKTVEERAEALALLARVSALGAAGGNGGQAKTRAALASLSQILREPGILELWSVPLATFAPVANSYREILFSYQ